MNSRLEIACPLVCVLLIVAFAAPAKAADYNLGVSVGHWVKYGNYVVTTPAEAALNPDWSMIEVVGVSGKDVTLRISGEYTNGTAITPSNVTCNVETGMIGGHQRYIIAANLNQGYHILVSPGSDTINKTETRTYLGVSRSVNILNFTSSMAGQSIRVTYIYDKASGMHLEMDMEITLTEPAATYKNSYSIIDTNIFGTQQQESSTIPVEWTVLIATIVVISAIVTGVLLMRRRK